MSNRKIINKRKKHLQRKIITLFFIVIALIISIFIITHNNNQPQEVSNNESINAANNVNENIFEAKEKEDSIKTYKAKLIAGGDALLHGQILTAANNPETGTNDFSHMLSLIKDEVSQYDIKYYNQEVIFDDDKPYTGYPTFNAPSAWGKNMVEDLGFNLVSLATNHSMDGGINSAKKSAAWWESHENIIATGMASSEEKSKEHKIMEANGIKYAMLAYTYGTNGIPVTEDYVVNIFDKEKALEDIKLIRDKVDVLIVAMHWGAEYNTGITDVQKEQAKFLGENGVDIILGNHTHCIEPWEWIDEDTIVFYAFGNLISNQITAESAITRKLGPIGYLGSLEITKTVDTENNTSKIKIDNIGADLIYTYRYYNNEKGKYDYLIVPFSKMESKYLSDYQSVYDEFSSILKTFDENITIAPLPDNDSN